MSEQSKGGTDWFEGKWFVVTDNGYFNCKKSVEAFDGMDVEELETLQKELSQAVEYKKSLQSEQGDST